PADSFVQWAVRQGHTVFMMSWVNPDTSHADLGLADYLVRGAIEAVTAVAGLSASPRLNVAGYCIGGFLAACTAAYLAAGNRDNIATLTLFNTMLDYSEPGDIGVFLSDRMLTSLEEHLQTQGTLDGRIMRQAFTMLREDRMFWPYVVNNYLLGKAPAPNPVLYWNRDATNLPRRMLSEFLRDMYRNNALCNSDNYTLAGRTISLDQVAVPVYALACRNDHIIPWRSAYNSTLLLAGDVRFVLSDSGHVMGVVNPPNKRQSGYWYAGVARDATDANTWLAGAVRQEGSWWPHWHAWLAGRQSGSVAARFPGADGNRIIERAPGRYVKNTL
ncbi:MAG: poly(3-hydroxyalkanoate) synthetase, partial [Gammaproteobacteria bacterium]|nr:poly(3-hydroxyalkanoate) synthetase [Gammaproteobacteria bacterium]